ncbi:glycoside hydrolase family 73 protein, partial [Burkholderia gladioli]|uniref:glycoside hydrolase family 73 protein n=1 Tax=Burkholderia gladioli TaxID=28095 RepID=UPI003F7A6DC1
RIRESPNGKIIGILPKGSELTVSDTDEVAKAKPGWAKPGWAKIKTIKSGTPAAAVVGGTPSPHAPYGYVYVKELDAVVNPQPLDSVVVLKQPYPVKAGDVVSQLGHYLRYTEAKLLPAKPTRPLLHLEVFAGPDLEAFIQKSRTRAKELPAAKTFLEISPGARLVTELAEPDQKLQPGVKLVPLDANAKGKWVKVQPKTAAPVHGGRHAKPTYTNSGAPVWVDGSLANTTTSAIVPGWKDFPLSFTNAKGPGADFRDVFRRVDLDKAGADSTVKDDKGRAWFLVTIGAKDGSTRQGWVCEQDHPLVRMCGPWDWPGFELIDNSSIMPLDMLKRYIHVTEQYLADESKTEFEASAATVNAGPLITNLEKAIDTDHDGKVTALELKHAQEMPWMAEALSHLVVRCESEWGGGLGKWEALSPLMKKLLWLWKTEIERIGKLQWWEQVASVEGFPKEPNPWHFHPIGLVGNFKSIRPAIVGTKSFPAEVIEAAQAAQAKWRIPASISLAQWALESGFGHHLPAGSNNPFGIKANKQDLASGNYVNAMTSEFVNGKEIRIPQPFRKFPSLNEAFDFHGQLLATGRAYAEARSKIPDAHEFAKALDHHYATDPNYSKKLIGNYIDPYNLTQYDLEE